MSRYQTAMATLSNALEKARAPSDGRAAKGHSHESLPLLVRIWRAVARWSARRDFNSHQ